MRLSARHIAAARESIVWPVQYRRLSCMSVLRGVFYGT